MNATDVMKALDPVTGLRIDAMPVEAAVAFDEEGHIGLETNEYYFPIAYEARKSFLSRIGMSNVLTEKLSSDTASRVGTELYRGGGESSALLKDGRIVHFLPKGEYRPVHSEAVLEALNEAIPGDDITINRALIQPNYDVQLEVVGPDTYSVAQGDLVRAGVAVKYNPAGITNPTIQTYGLRLVCTNGMTATEVMETSTLRDVEEGYGVYDWIKEASGVAYESLSDSVERWQRLREDVIEPKDRPLLLNSLVREAGLKKADATALWSKATEEPPETAYDILNLMTWLSSHVIEDPRKVVSAQSATADFVDREIHQKLCPTCERAG